MVIKLFESNLLKTKKYVNTLSCTTSIYSILTTPELIAHMKTLDIATYLSILDSPTYFDMRLLPDNIKEKINKKFDLLKQKFFFTSDQEENINRNIDYLNKSIENKDKLLKNFKAFNNQVDSLNKTSFTKTYPELAEWYETI